MRRDAVVGRLFTLSMLLATAGCGGATPGPEEPGTEPPRAGPEAEDLLPTDSFAYARFDVAALRDSPYAPTVARWYRSWGSLLTQDDEEAAVFARLVEVLAEHADEVVGAAYGCGGGPCELRVALVFRGDFSDRPIERLAWTIPRAEQQIDERQVEGHPALVIDTPEELTGVRLGDDAWLWAPLAWAKQALRSGSRGEGPLTGPALSPLARRVDPSDAAVTLMATLPPEERGRSLFGDLDLEGADRIRSAAVQLDASDGLSLLALADLPTDADARTVAASAERSMGESAEHPLVILLGLDELVAASTIDASDRSVELRMRLPDQRTRELLFHWEKLAGAAAAFFSGDHPGSLGSLLGLMPRPEPPRTPEPPEPPPAPTPR